MKQCVGNASTNPAIVVRCEQPATTIVREYRTAEAAKLIGSPFNELPMCLRHSAKFEGMGGFHVEAKIAGTRIERIARLAQSIQRCIEDDAYRRWQDQRARSATDGDMNGLEGLVDALNEVLTSFVHEEAQS